LGRKKSFLSKVPSGTGWKNIVHYGQIMNAKKFQRFDFGKRNN